VSSAQLSGTELHLITPDLADASCKVVLITGMKEGQRSLPVGLAIATGMPGMRCDMLWDVPGLVQALVLHGGALSKH
jgi:hypothetical protein